MKKDNTIIYCTYFDKGFLLKGLALRESLVRYNPNAKLWILALDDYTENILKKMKLKGVTVVAMKNFEDKELLAVKNTRHLVEYYWTCTPSWILYVLKKNPNVGKVTYLDADLYFYSNPDVGVNEIGDKSILLVEHRFPKGKEKLVKIAGRFNVAFNVFKNDKVSIQCLKRWRNQCLDWCYWTPVNGKLGDQMYLDEWPKLYGKNLMISKNVGVDTAPWNISQYDISNRDGSVRVNSDRFVCYHFHQFQILSQNHFIRVSGYFLSKDVVRNIYEPYEKELMKMYEKVIKIDKNFKIEKLGNDGKVTFKHKIVKYFSLVYWKNRFSLVWLGN